MRLLALAFLAALVSACGAPAVDGIDPRDSTQVTRGRAVYDQHCASCHGAKLEGQTNWRTRLPDGRLPAPPHDESGHTWHHPNDVLFGIVKNGMVPPHAPPNYKSDMPGFAATLSDDDIRAVIAYIESHWPREVWDARREMVKRR
jgi:mono/diheme cytochrome c family protein